MVIFNFSSLLDFDIVSASVQVEFSVYKIFIFSGLENIKDEF